MDNQIRRLAWVGGFFDGEAYIGISSKPSYQKSNPTLYEPLTQVSNTSRADIDELAQIFEENGIAYYRRTEPSRKPEHKEQERILARGLRRNLKLLWVIEPYLIGKKQQAQFVLAFIASRLGQTNTRTRYPRDTIHPNNMPYTQDEINIYRAIKEMNCRGSIILNEYTQRATPFVAMMYSELRAKGADATEMIARLDNEVIK